MSPLMVGWGLHTQTPGSCFNSGSCPFLNFLILITYASYCGSYSHTVRYKIIPTFFYLLIQLTDWLSIAKSIEDLSPYLVSCLPLLPTLSSENVSLLWLLYGPSPPALLLPLRPALPIKYGDEPGSTPLCPFFTSQFQWLSLTIPTALFQPL